MHARTQVCHVILAAGLACLTACGSSGRAGDPASPTATSNAQGSTNVRVAATEPTGEQQAAVPAPASNTQAAAETAVAKETQAQAARAIEWKEVFPDVRLSHETKTIELRGTVPIDAHDATKPRVYLEVIACTPDSKEHEALVMTQAKPSHVHAALLLLGLEPGVPGGWRWEGEKPEAISPSGPTLRVSFVYQRDGTTVEVPAADWAVTTQGGATLSSAHPEDHFVFAGSRLVQRKTGEAYWADSEGTLIGLTTFGGETIAWSRVYSHDSAVETPHWIANAATVPAFGTPVTIRIQAQNAGK